MVGWGGEGDGGGGEGGRGVSFCSFGEKSKLADAKVDCLNFFKFLLSCLLNITFLFKKLDSYRFSIH